MTSSDESRAPSGGGRQRVLHISEAMAGGVEAAVLEYVRSSPGRDHYIAFSRRGGYRTGDLESAGFVVARELHGNPFWLWQGFRRMIDEVQPDIVHLHSAWAGLLGRINVRRPTYRVVYSPHSYYFDRLDIPPVTRWAARMMERTLASRTDAVAAVSPFEAEQAERMGANAVYVPNVVRIDPELTDRARSELSVPATVTAVGRLSAQKDPDFFIAVKRACDAKGAAFSWVWLGGGDDDLDHRVRAAGVEVSGWLPRDAAIRRLADTDIYVHTAAWEGSPISLLEVAAMRIPRIVRSIDATVSLGYPAGLSTPEQVAAALIALAAQPLAAWVPEPAAAGGVDLQQTALLELYDGDGSSAVQRKGRIVRPAARLRNLTGGTP